ncbi:hypothetical protein EDD18DRAFT_1337139 [Armillaria luteobubalina]|uniref:Uncharacterized protein n=1 Tax=Armillaria luteobubalina TaxID=153913 RepID=A0AA39PAZ6_9AGAR|nr:hypothetical protein EDD18DRAFT_1337139 [Armillaria luteobubalina]
MPVLHSDYQAEPVARHIYIERQQPEPVEDYGFYIVHDAPGNKLKITIHVESQEDGDGISNMSSFKRAARRCLADILNSITFLVEFVWTRGDLNEFGEYSMRYTDDGGCIVVAAGPTVIEGKSTCDLALRQAWFISIPK